MSEHDEAIKAIEDRIEERVKTYEGQVAESGEALKSIRDEIKGLSEDYEARIKELEQSGAGYNGGEPVQAKSIGEQFVDSDVFARYKSGESGRASVEMKNTVLGTSNNGGSTNGIITTDHQPGIYGGALRALRLLDVVPQGVTSSNSVEYAREQAFTNGAKETAEGAKAGESELSFSTINDPVRNIPSFIRVSRQVLDDAPALQSYINSRLLNGVRSKLEAQIIQGTGTGVQLGGIAMADRHAAFTPTSKETAIDAINRAKAQVLEADHNPDMVVLNPTDWAQIERIKKSDNGYVAAEGAAVSYVNNGLQPTIWGMPVVQTNSVPKGKFFVADSISMMLFNRDTVSVDMFAQDADNATSGLITVMASLRAAFGVFAQAGIVYGDLVAETTSGS